MSQKSQKSSKSLLSGSGGSSEKIFDADVEQLESVELAEPAISRSTHSSKKDSSSKHGVVDKAADHDDHADPHDPHAVKVSRLQM